MTKEVAVAVARGEVCPMTKIAFQAVMEFKDLAKTSQFNKPVKDLIYTFKK
jgi:FPC/CPF motif-containing protein YcgG